MFPQTPLPPQPIITRWGSWIDAAVYFADHFDEIELFLPTLDAKDAKCIGKAQNSIQLPNLKNELAFIKCHFAIISLTITKLEKKGRSLTDAIEKFEAIRPRLEAITKKPEFLRKFNYVVDKNTGLATLKIIADILQTSQSNETDLVEKLTPAEIEAFKYAPITSSDVERTFSSYKRVLEDCRRSFLFENLRKHIVIHCNHFHEH